MYIVVVEDDEGLRGVLRTWMKETGSIVTGYDKPKTYDGIDILIIGPNASQVDMTIVEEKHIPFFRIGLGADIDAVLSWVLDMQKEIAHREMMRRADQYILEDR